MTARKGTHSSWARFLAILLLLWMFLVPMAAMAGGEDDPGNGGVGNVDESAMAPPEDEQYNGNDGNWNDWAEWLLWLLTIQILP